jgi:hydroxymethylpyrimidine/phosphomethylpyrimidine kinase
VHIFMTEPPFFALTIAGSDSGGGAGIQADLKAFASAGVFGLSTITAVTAQNSRAVSSVLALPAELIAAQLAAIISDFPVKVAKTGMLANASVIAAINENLPADMELIVDPVMIASSGARLIDQAGIAQYRLLIGRASLITPNLPEAEVLLGRRIGNAAQAKQAALDLLALGAGAVLLKGGHGAGKHCIDWLVDKNGTHRFSHPRLAITGHGTGCTLSAAIAAERAKGRPMLLAVRYALRSLHTGLRHSLPIGNGGVSTPDPFWPRYRKAAARTA